MKTILLIICSILYLSCCEDEFPFDKDVIILTDSTFDKAIQKYEYLMVYFYAPWCIRCNKFHPEYDEAAFILRNQDYAASAKDLKKIVAVKSSYYCLLSVRKAVTARSIASTTSTTASPA